MDNQKEPQWLEEFRKREAEGDRDLRLRLIDAWGRHAGVTRDMAVQILDGVPAHSPTIDTVAKWVLGIPSQDALRACEICAWSGKEKDCGECKACPQCGQGTYPLPPVF